MLYTIGHSNHSPEKFLDLLKEHDIRTLVDVRSWPSSRRWSSLSRAPAFVISGSVKSLAAKATAILQRRSSKAASTNSPDWPRAEVWR